MKQIILGGVLGGLTLFVWMFVAHDVLPLGEIGVKEIANEAAVLNAIQGAIPGAGFYFFPGTGLPPTATRAERSAAMPALMKKYEQVPHGILIYHPPAGPFRFGAALGTEFVLNLVQALLAALLLSCAGGLTSYGGRVGFVFVAGLLAALTTNVEYWNWYNFPTDYTAGLIATQVIGLLLAGLVIAAFVKKQPAA